MEAFRGVPLNRRGIQASFGVTTHPMRRKDAATRGAVISGRRRGAAALYRRHEHLRTGAVVSRHELTSTASHGHPTTRATPSASARPTVQRPTIISGPPPNPAVSLLYDAVASGCANAGARRQADAAAKLHFDPDLPAFIPPPPPSRKQLRQQAPSKDAPQPQLMPPSPSIGQRASKLLNGPPARLTSTSDPELLQKFLHLVRQGLRDADEPGTPGYIEQRLEVFRRAFGHYISAFGNYSPLLLGVQEAYEDALAHAVARARPVVTR